MKNNLITIKLPSVCFQSHQHIYVQFVLISEHTDVLSGGLCVQRAWMSHTFLSVLTCLDSLLQHSRTASPVASCLTHLCRLYCLVGQRQLIDTGWYRRRRWPQEFPTMHWAVFASSVCICGAGFDNWVTCSDNRAGHFNSPVSKQPMQKACVRIMQLLQWQELVKLAQWNNVTFV